MLRALFVILGLGAVFPAAEANPADPTVLPDPSSGPPDAAPVVMKQVRPDFPPSLRRSGYKGTVLIDFIVGPNGDVVRAAVIESSHPDFEAPAVEAVLKWRFKPGMKHGHPVFTHMRVPIIFSLTEYANFSVPPDDGGADMWSVPASPPKGVPAPFAYDVPPSPLLTTAPVYPFDLLVAEVTGTATVTFAVDPTGQPQLMRLESASNPEFGASAVAMIGSWRFKPATQHGKPCWALLRKDVVFERDNREFPLGDSTRRLLRDLKRTPCPILADARKLDEPIHGRFQPGPMVPLDVRKTNLPEEAVVEFIVDHAGHAQLPRVVSATNPEFGWAAATAVARWQFTQPISAGHPVDVRARVPVAFQPQKAPPQGT